MPLLSCIVDLEPDQSPGPTSGVPVTSSLGSDVTAPANHVCSINGDITAAKREFPYSLLLYSYSAPSYQLFSISSTAVAVLVCPRPPKVEEH